MQFWKVHEVATLTGVTVRTLHHYDSIGLLSPSKVTEAGYRLYDEAALARLQQILFFKELDFSLKEIHEIMQSPSYDAHMALRRQKEMLLEKSKRLQDLVQLLDDILEGKREMDFKPFDTENLQELRAQYAQEAKQRWGDTAAYAECAEKQKQYKKADWDRLSADSAEIFRAFAACRTVSPQAEAAQKLVERWKQYLTEHYYTCTNEILAGLGQMYVSDARFRKNLDAYGEGTAAFIAEAIAAYCKAEV